MGAKSDVVIKLVLVFFIALLSFSIGTFVGKKYSDNQHNLAQLEPESKSTKDHGERSVASQDESEHDKVGKTEKSEIISDEEIKKISEENLKDEEFVADDSKNQGEHESQEVHGNKSPHEGAHGANVEVTKKDEKEEIPHRKMEKQKSGMNEKNHGSPSHGSPSHGSPLGNTSDDEVLAAAKELLDGKVPQPKMEAHKENRLPSSLPKDVAQYALGKFTVQVASYADKAEAEKKAKKLKDQGYQTNVFTAQIEGKIWYRVSFGLYATQEEAVAEKHKYLDKNKTETALVQKIKN